MGSHTIITQRFQGEKNKTRFICLSFLRIQSNFFLRFQGPRPSLQQQHSKKILQRAKEDRAKKFGNIQNIPVIGRQTMKRPSTDAEEASPPKMIKPETAARVGCFLLKYL